MGEGLIVVDPFQRFGADEDRILEYLEERSGCFDGIFYIGMAETLQDGSKLKKGRWRDYSSQEFSRLPPGFSEGVYDDSLREAYWDSDSRKSAVVYSEVSGKVSEREAERLAQFDTIYVGGADGSECVPRCINSVDEMVDAEVHRLNEITFSSIASDRWRLRCCR